MWPWGHLAFAYITYRGATWQLKGTSVAGMAVVFLGLGALAPDLIDKTFAWTIPVLPSGRSLVHSVLIVSLVGFGLHVVISKASHRVLASAFFFGSVSHLIADAIPGLLQGNTEAVYFWNWPFPPHPEYTLDSSFVSHFAELQTDLLLLSQGEFGRVGWVAIEFVITGIVGIVWLFDGAPGVRASGRALRNIWEKIRP